MNKKYELIHLLLLLCGGIIMSIKPKKKELEYSIDDLQYIWNNDDYANESASTSKRYKRNINRIFRNIIKSKRIPYPEVDNIFFRIRDKCCYTFRDKKK
jgi:hypothetical protein